VSLLFLLLENMKPKIWKDNRFLIQKESLLQVHTAHVEQRCVAVLLATNVVEYTIIAVQHRLITIALTALVCAIAFATITTCIMGTDAINAF